jgi:hypothetical protein
MGGNQAHSSGDILEINVRENRIFHFVVSQTDAKENATE